MYCRAGISTAADSGRDGSATHDWAFQVPPASVVTTVSSADVHSDLNAAQDVIEATAVPVLALVKLADTIPSGRLGLDT